METAYDVFKGTPESKPLWLGTISGLRRAIQMMNMMGERLPGSYFIVEQGYKKSCRCDNWAEFSATNREIELGYMPKVTEFRDA